MKGIALFLGMVVLSEPLWAVGPPPGVKYGWKPENDGSLSYIAQVTPEIANQMMSPPGLEIALDIPDFLQGKVNRVVWRIGNADVEREPSQAELQAIPNRFPSNAGQNSLSPGSLTSLNGSDGQTVMIDPQRPKSATLPTAGVGRAIDTDPSMLSVPSLAQTFPSNNSRATGSQFDMPGMNSLGNYPSSNSGSSSNSFGPKSVLPKQDTLPFGQNNFVGPPLPSGYTGGQVTINGSSSNVGTPYGGNDPRMANNPNPYGTNNPNPYGTNNPNPYGTNNPNNYGTNNPNAYGTNNPNSYGSNNPIASGTFGNSNPLGPNPTSNSYSPLGNNFSTSNPSYSTSNQAYPSNNQGSFASNPGYMPPSNSYPYSNGISGPDARFASTNTLPGNTHPGNTLPPNTMPPNTMSVNVPINTLPMNGLPNNSMNANPNNSMNVNRGQYPNGVLPNGYESPTSPSYMVTLLFLVSLVGNVYLAILLNQLFQRYRTLQANTRGVTSLAV